MNYFFNNIIYQSFFKTKTTTFIIVGFVLSVLISSFYIKSLKDTVAQVFSLNLRNNLSIVDQAQVVSTARLISSINEVMLISINFDDQTIFQHQKKSVIGYLQSTFEIEHPYNKQLRIVVGIVPSNPILLVSLINLFLWTFLSFKIKKMAYSEGVRSEAGFSEITRRFAHDIRKPLDQLMGLLNSKPNLITRDMVELIDYSKELTEDLLRARVNDISENFNPVQVFQLALSIQKHHSKTDCLIEFKDMINGYISIWGSSVSFKRSMINFIQNSIDALTGHSHPQIQIVVSLEDKKLKFLIKDNGAGFPEEILKSNGRIGKSFKSGGIGLGLKSSVENIERMGGYVIISNENGACIEVVFDNYNFIQKQLDTKFRLVLVDDDKYTAIDWKKHAEINKIEFEHFENISNLMGSIDKFNENDFFFIDSYLPEGKGEVLSKILFDKRFNNLYLATNFFSEDLSRYPWIKGVVDKAFPVTLLKDL